MSETIEDCIADLHAAIRERERVYDRAVDKIRHLAPEEHEDKIHKLTSEFREATFLLMCFRRLLLGCDRRAIYKAFGAPGDFGYETPIGSALDRLYRADEPPRDASSTDGAK